MKQQGALPLCLLAALLFLVSACKKLHQPTGEDEKDPTETVIGGDDERSYLTVAEALAGEEDSYELVVGYVVGYVNGTAISASVFDLPTAQANTNMLLADSPTETNTAKVFPVALPTTGDNWRSQVNLLDHPELFHKAVAVEGTLTRYFRTIGIKNPKSISLVVFDDEDPDDDTGGTGENEKEGESVDTLHLPFNHGGTVIVGR